MYLFWGRKTSSFRTSHSEVNTFGKHCTGLFLPQNPQPPAACQLNLYVRKASWPPKSLYNIAHLYIFYEQPQWCWNPKKKYAKFRKQNVVIIQKIIILRIFLEELYSILVVLEDTTVFWFFLGVSDTTHTRGSSVRRTQYTQLFSFFQAIFAAMRQYICIYFVAAILSATMCNI